MKRPDKNIGLLILMIVSQIMLTGLLVQWLRSQWLAEKELLQKDLTAQFRESVDQVIDSMLVKHLIVPVLNDSSVNSTRLIRFNKKIPPEGHNPSKRVLGYYNEQEGKKEAYVTITLPDSVKEVQQDNYEFSTYDSTKKNMLIRSVKLIISHSGDSTGEWSQFNHMSKDSPDTTLLKELFQSKLSKSVPGLATKWIVDTAKQNHNPKSKIIYLKSNLFEKPFDAEILHFRQIVLKRVSPQILFALLLLTFTGAAFFFTYRSLRRMETLNELRNDFISNISHELKTPVSTVTIALEALKNFDMLKDSARSNEYLDIAFSEMKRLDQLISQVLNTSVLDDKNKYLKMEETDLVSLTKDVLHSMQVRFSKANAKVEFKTVVEVCELSIDKLHIQGVLINLLDNSLKYSSENPEISVSLTTKSQTVSLLIRDNGPGIPNEYLQRVFDKFFRVPKGDRHDVKGYGLGLSYAEQVMRHHSGSVSVRNVNTGGCEFILTFPKSGA